MYPFLPKKLLISFTALSLALGAAFLFSANRTSAAPAEQTGTTGQHHQRCSVIDEAASVIGIQPSQLRDILSQGKSIADAAKEKGISESELTAKLVAVRSGKLESKINDLIHQKGTPGAWKEKEPVKNQHHSLLRHIGTDKLSSIIGVPKEELDKQLQSGKSLAEIAQTRGIGKTDLIGKLKDSLAPALEKEIEHKAAQEPVKK